MKTIYKRVIGLLMALPGLGLLYLAYTNGSFGVTFEQIIIFIAGAFISTIIVMSFFYGAWLRITGAKEE